MQTIEYRDVQNKSAWGPGPWQDEPDKKQWQDEATGLPCMIVRSRLGALCGYVGVPAGHRYYGASYDEFDVDVHGGITFADKCQPSPTLESWEKWRARLLGQRDEALVYPKGDAATELRERAAELESYDAFVKYHENAAICHIVEKGEADDIWWLGFDCSHYMDFAPRMAADLQSIGRGSSLTDGIYRDFAYVSDQVTQLAAQLAEVRP